MNKKMRKSTREIDSVRTVQILITGEYGVLSTVDHMNQPYGTPLSYVYVNDAIYFHCANDGHKLENIENEAKVSFTVVGRTNVMPEIFSTAYESVIVFGTAGSVVEDEKKLALMELAKKYSNDFLSESEAYIEKYWAACHVYKIEISNMTGKASRI